MQRIETWGANPFNLAKSDTGSIVALNHGEGPVKAIMTDEQDRRHIVILVDANIPPEQVDTINMALTGHDFEDWSKRGERGSKGWRDTSAWIEATEDRTLSHAARRTIAEEMNLRSGGYKELHFNVLRPASGGTLPENEALVEEVALILDGFKILKLDNLKAEALPDRSPD